MFLLVEPATFVFGRLAESGIAFRALALTVIFFEGIRWYRSASLAVGVGVGISVKFLLGTVPVLICFPIRMAFFFPNPVRSRSDPVTRHDWVRLAAWDTHAWRVSVTARVLREGVVDRFGSRRRGGRGMSAS